MTYDQCCCKIAGSRSENIAYLLRMRFQLWLSGYSLILIRDTLDLDIEMVPRETLAWTADVWPDVNVRPVAHQVLSHPTGRNASEQNVQCIYILFGTLCRRLFKDNVFISSLDLSALIKREFITTSTVKCPDFSLCKISPDGSNGKTRLN
jgi:hypothetical protein